MKRVNNDIEYPNYRDTNPAAQKKAKREHVMDRSGEIDCRQFYPSLFLSANLDYTRVIYGDSNSIVYLGDDNKPVIIQWTDNLYSNKIPDNNTTEAKRIYDKYCKNMIENPNPTLAGMLYHLNKARSDIKNQTNQMYKEDVR